MDCINLQQQFGKRYRITFDPAYDPRNRPKDKLDPWMMQLPCQRGVVYPHGGSLLGVEVDGRPITSRQLSESGVCTLHQDGDREKTFLFDVADMPIVAKIIKPRRRRQVSEQERARLSEMSKATRFQPTDPASRSLAASANER